MSKKKYITLNFKPNTFTPESLIFNYITYEIENIIDIVRCEENESVKVTILTNRIKLDLFLELQTGKWYIAKNIPE